MVSSPEPPLLPAGYLAEARDFAVSQANGTLNSLYDLLEEPAVWINRRRMATFSTHKLKQLQVATALGMAVPATLITNCERQAKQFFAEHGDVCVKNIDAAHQAIQGLAYPFHTIHLTAADKEQSLALVQNGPTLFQEFIHKCFDLRVTIIGRRLFGVAIYSQERPESQEDFRLVEPSLLRHVIHAIPSTLQNQILKFMDYYGLNFSAMDFAVTQDGRYLFLENNPNGQWLWLEELTGIPISEGFVDFIIECIRTRSELRNGIPRRAIGVGSSSIK